MRGESTGSSSWRADYVLPQIVPVDLDADGDLDVTYGADYYGTVVYSQNR